MFVPLANLAAYPIIAFHDGWKGPHKIGLLLGTLITVGSMAPYYTAFQLLEDGSRRPFDIFHGPSVLPGMARGAVPTLYGAREGSVL